MRCKVCKNKFEVVYFNQKFCSNECKHKAEKQPKKKPKRLYKCKQCKTPFERMKPLQAVCSPICAIEYSKVLEAKKRKKEWSIEKKKQLPYVYSIKYKNLLQSQINLLSRKIDAHFNYLCIDCNKLFGKQTDGAHLHNVQGNENIRFNLHNIHSARSDCNKYSSEHKNGYRIGIEKRYGEKYLHFIDFELRNKYNYLGLSEVEIYETLAVVRKINREFEKIIKNKEFTSIEMRDYFNLMIGIYK